MQKWWFHGSEVRKNRDFTGVNQQKSVISYFMGFSTVVFIFFPGHWRLSDSGSFQFQLILKTYLTSFKQGETHGDKGIPQWWETSSSVSPQEWTLDFGPSKLCFSCGTGRTHDTGESFGCCFHFVSSILTGMMTPFWTHIFGMYWYILMLLSWCPKHSKRDARSKQIQVHTRMFVYISFWRNTCMICIGVSKWLIYMTSVLAATRSFISVWIGILQSYEVTASQGAWDAHPIEGLPIFMLQWFLYVPIFGRWTIWRTPP